MAASQIQLQETIRGMKLALRRQSASSRHKPPSPIPSLTADNDDDDDDDDDESAAPRSHTNRGHKLQPHARHLREGRLDNTSGRAYKRKAQHAGFTRNILAKRPKLYDDDGDLVDPADAASDAEHPIHAEPNREDAFGEVKLEALLRPLTSAAELVGHPSLSQAFTGRALTQLAEQAAEMLRREKKALWRGKRLLERLRGDGGGMAGGRFEIDGEEGWLLDGEGGSVGGSVEVEADEGRLEVEELEVAGVGNGVAPSVGEDVLNLPRTLRRTELDVMEGVEARDQVFGTARPEHSKPADGPSADESHMIPNGALPSISHPALTALQHQQQQEVDTTPSLESTSTAAPSHAMTTRARARSPQARTSPSPSPSSPSSLPAIHPWYLFPTSSLSDADAGLPANEAEDTRKPLLLYVQKQTNIVRQLHSLYEGLQRVDRVRREVYRACRAEAHLVPDARGVLVTEMSDGEDWYDVEDWGLQAWELREGVGLEKGKDEVDDGAEEEGRRVGGRRRRVVGR